MEKISKMIKLFKIKINIEKSLEFIDDLVKQTSFCSVGFTELYLGQLNLFKYIICWLHIIIFLIITFGFILFIKFDFLWNLIDNEFLPENTRSLLVVIVVLMVLTIACRFDIAISEWNKRCKVYKYYYYLRENIKSKHGLTKKNYKKIEILTKILELFVIKGCVPLIVLLIFAIHLYSLIRTQLITLYLLIPVAIYSLYYGSATLSLMGSLSIISLYYFTLLFGQIDNRIKRINDQSKQYVSLANQKRLIQLINRHNSIANLIYQNNFITRRLLLVFFFTLALMQTIPLNLLLKTHNLYYRMFYLIYSFVSLSYGFAIAYFLSLQITAAHKPYKIIYDILTKKRIPLQIKWKV